MAVVEYPGYAKPSHRLPWVAHEALLSAWRGEHGGTDSARVPTGASWRQV